MDVSFPSLVLCVLYNLGDSIELSLTAKVKKNDAEQIETDN